MSRERLAIRVLKREEAMRENLQDDRKQVNQGEKKVVEVMVEVVTGGVESNTSRRKEENK